MNIAVVGAGVSGLTAAYLLNRAHDVTLFERADYAGGHAHTAEVPTERGAVPVDTGFIVYNETTYPGFTGLLRELDVPTQPSEMSFSSRCRACDLEFSSRGVAGFFAQRRSLLRGSQWRLLADLRAFYRDARVELGGGAVAASAGAGAGAVGDLTLGDYLERGGAARPLGRHFLVPMAAAVWSTAPEDVRDFPLHYLLRFLDNHGLIGFGRTLQWRTVTGGSREYVRRLLATLPAGAVHLDAGAVAVEPRVDGGVDVVLDGGARRRFDAVVLATHADVALRLLASPTPEERRALGGFRYTPNRVVLHTDAAATLPRSADARAAWNVVTDDCARPGEALTMTYDLTRLQSLPGDERYLVSVNPGDLDARRVIAEYAYDHPLYGFETLAAQRAVRALQGARGIYYAGAHLGYGFHEDGFRSGAEVARLLGAVPWESAA